MDPPTTLYTQCWVRLYSQDAGSASWELRLWSDPLHSGTSTMDPPTTLYTQCWVRLYSQYAGSASWELRLWSHPLHSGTSTMEPPTTLYTQCWVRLYSQAADAAWVNLTFRQAILCDAAADQYCGFHKVYFETLALKCTIHSKNLSLSTSIVPLIRTKTSAHNKSLSTHTLANSVTWHQPPMTKEKVTIKVHKGAFQL